ncbi:NCS2 family permease [Geitlerinema sp. PCC 9228]|jgi:AGZA family xanthine/uracil permease-like MFS transporter|uniref:NCS2 family permease n=1 Tax=Geitlerinema sp. PCC 9228 TaxID=111611 RepID=UPI0008F99BAB|nr:NCS2 family permease [Geitlerinema sp. PCC 9228]
MNPLDSHSTFVARFFKFAENGTTLRTEILAGITTFFTMAYILAVNPGILGEAIFLEQPQDLFAELAIATAIASAIATLVMALFANYPFALAPGMGLNAFFAFSVVLGMGIDWRVALFAIFLEGLLFIILTLTELRSHLLRAIPDCLKQATAAGIGLFLAYIAVTGDPESGSSGSGIIAIDQATTTTLGNLANPATVLAIAGIFLTAILMVRRIQGALLLGILGTAWLGWILGIAAAPAKIVEIPPFPTDLWGQAISAITNLPVRSFFNIIPVLLVFLFVDLFDTIGTLTGLGIQAGYINENSQLPRGKSAFMADAVGTTVGAILGTSTVTTYVESAAGVSQGGRTGFTGLVVAVLFLISIFFIPLLAAIPAFATAGALLMVGILMAGSIQNIRWHDPAEAIPAFFILLGIPLSFSIADGLAMGTIAYPILKTAQGKFREISLTVWALAGLFVLKFVLANPTAAT